MPLKNPWLTNQPAPAPPIPGVEPPQARQAVAVTPPGEAVTYDQALVEARALAARRAEEDRRRKAAVRTEQWRAMDPQNSAVSHDDGEHQSWLETMVSSMGEAQKSTRDVLGFLMPDITGKRRKFLDEQERTTIGEIPSFPRYLGQGMEDVTRSELVYKKNILKKPLSEDEERQLAELTDKRNSRDPAQAAPKSIAGQVIRALPSSGHVFIQSLPAAADGGMIGATAGSAVPGVGTVAGAISGFSTGATVGSMGPSFKLNSAEAFEDFSAMRDEKGNPIPVDVVRAASIGYGVIATGLDTFAFSKELKLAGIRPGAISAGRIKQLLMDKPFRDGLQELVERLGPAAFYEGSTEGMQATVQYFIGKLAQADTTAKTGVDFKGDNPVEVVKGIANEALVGGITGAAVVAPGATYQAIQQEQLANEAKAREQFLKSLGEGPDSKLKAELPEKYREYAEHLTRDGPVADVYITASAFREYFQSQNVDPEEAAREMGLPPGEVARALSEGGEIKLPMADYLTKVVKTPAGEALMPHIKFAPGDLQMTSAEAADAEANKPTVLEALAAEGKARQDMSEEERKGRLELRSQIGARLAADPDFTIGQIETTADNFVDQYYGLARVLEIPIDEVLTRFPIPNINAERGISSARPSAPQMRGGNLPDGYEARLVKRESGGKANAKATTSSALGLHQFVASTWIGVIKQHGLPGDPNAKAVAASIQFKDGRPIIVNEAQRALLARRTNAADSTAAFRAFTADNAKFLRGVLGRDPSAGELYTAHFLGNGGAQTLLKADDNAIARDLKGLKAAAAANTTIFYEGKGKNRRPRTVAEVKANLFATFEGVDAPVAGGVQLAGGVESGVDTPIPDGPQAPEMGPGGETFDQFAGRRALTADMGKLRVAQLMEKRDASPTDIWEATGWNRGKDNQWRFEIDDSQARLKPDGVAKLEATVRDITPPSTATPGWTEVPSDVRAFERTGQVTLGELIDHDALFAAYPRLRDVPVYLGGPRGSRGSFSPSTGEMTIGPEITSLPEQIVSTTLHEVQHMIQTLEGFASGAPGTADGLRRAGYGDALDRAIDEIVNTYPPAEQDSARRRARLLADAVYETYRRSEGEVEARNTQARQFMSEAERRDTPPDYTRDVQRRFSVVAPPPETNTFRDRYLDAAPNPVTRTLADAYRAKYGRTRPAPLAPVEPDEGMMMRFADEYDAQISKPTDPAVIASYDVAATELEEQAHFIVGHLELERWTGKGEPYPNSTAMIEDVLLRGHFYFLPTERESFGAGNPEDMNHPFLRETELTDSNGTPLLVNDLFRIVHDVFAHTTGGAGFGPKGELNAFLEHASMFSDAALPAVAAETLMQNAWVNYGKHLRRPDGTLPKRGESDYVGLADRRFADQKAILAPQWVLREVFQLQERSDREGRHREQEAALLREYNRLREGQGLAPDATRIEPLAGPDGRVTLTHWGRRKNLKALDPRRWGDNATILTREERNAVENDDVPRRTYYGLDVGQPWGYEREDGLGPHRYTARIDVDRLYDFDADPDGLKDKVVELIESGEWARNERGSAYERVIADAGYAGYWSRHANLKMVAVVFERLEADYQGNGETTFYQEDVFYSGLGRAIEQAQTKRAPPEQWAATLKKTPGVKAEELEWSGVLDWLAGIEGPVEREALLAFVNSNGVKLEVVELGGADVEEAREAYVEEKIRERIDELYSDAVWEPEYFVEEGEVDPDDGDAEPFWIAAGERFDTEDEAQAAADEYNMIAEREWVESTAEGQRREFEREAEAEIEGQTQFDSYKLPGADDTYREILFRLPNIDGPSTHWDQDNVVAHARITTRQDAEGNPILFVEEVQSDWHQKGRDIGYKSDATPEAIAAAEAEAAAADRAYALAVIDRVQFAKDVLLKARDTMRANAERTNADADVRRLIEMDFNRRATNLNAAEPWRQLTQAADVIGTFATLTATGVDPTEAPLQQARLRADEASQKAKNLYRGIPNAPFRTGWPALVMKRLIRYAVDQNIDRIAWTTADQIGPVVGANSPEQRAGLNAFYGRNLVNIVNDLTKKYGARVGGLRLTGINDGRGFTQEYYDLMGRIRDTEDPAERATIREEVAALEAAGGIEAFNQPENPALTITSALADAARGGFTLFQRERPAPSLAPAIRYGGRLYRGTDHLAALSAVPEDQRQQAALSGDRVFVTERGKVLNRFKAADYARSFDLLKDDAPEWAKTAPELIAENLADPTTLAQREGDGTPIRRGSIQMDRANFGKGVSSTVNLFVDRNLTTALHEGAHFFLEAMISTVRDGTATPLMVDMVNDLLGWFNVPTVDDIGRREHEMYAEAYEQYLYEGVAPAPRLRGQFSRIRVWMVAAYSRMGGRRLDVTDEVRSVFDRLLASQTEVEEARAMQGLEPLFADPASAGMDPVLAEAYQTVARRAKADADDEAAREIMAAVSREQKAWYRDERERVRAEVAAELAEDPGYQALDWLSRGKWIGAEQPTDLEPFKLSRPIIVSEYGADQLKSFPPSFGKVYAAEGVHPDFAAELFGFDSGQAMFDDWKGKPRRSDATEQETDRRMLERYGDPMTDGTLPDVATDAVHNVSQQRLIELELEHLQGRPAFKGLRAAAERQAEDRTIKDLAGYDRHLANERRAANEAQRAFRAKDLTAAAQAKFRQLVAFHAWTVSRAAAKEVEKGQNLFDRVVGGKADRVAAARNMDYVMAARAILAAYGVGKASQNPLAYMAMIREYDPETAAMLEPEVLALLPAQPRTLESLTLNEFRGLAETVKSLYALSRKLKTIEIEGRVMELDAAALELGEQIFAVSKMPGGFEPTTSTSDGEKLLRGAAGIRNSIRRVESWARRMDGGTVGPFTRLLWRPISAAADDYRALSGDLRTRYAALLEMIRPTLTWKKISAPELGHVFADKSELLHAILHTGNESNKRKLLLGGSGKGGWVQLDENGEMQTGPWDNMIRRLADEGVLTKADFDFAQAVWDLLDSTKPGAQRAHRKIVGRYFDEVTANEVQTPFGPYRGGYVPALADPTKVVDAGLRAEIESAVDGGGASMFPTTPRGFTKGRVENYTKPLALDLRLLAQHLDKVAMFTHLAAPVKDASRLLMHSDVREPLGQHDPAAMTDMLIPWLERTSRQIVQTPTRGLGGKLGDRFFASIRSRTGQQTMLGNLVNTLQQITGFTVAMVLVKPTSLAKGLVTMMTSPAETAAAIAEASPMMRDRMSAQTMEAAYGIEAILLRPNPYTTVRQFTGKHAYFMQHAFQNIVDTVTWVAAHGEALEAGETEAEARKRADAVIRQTQGSMNPEDLSRWESGPAIARLFTQFGGWFNMQSNLLLTEGGQALRDRNYARLVWVYMMGFAVTAVMAEAIKVALRGEFEDKEDDGWLDEWLDWLVGSQFRGATALVPVVGPAINASANAFNDKPFDDKLSLSPGVSAVDSAIRTPKNIAQIMAGEGDWSRTAKDTLTLMGLATGIPFGALNRPLGYGIDVAEGDVVPTDPLDAVRGAVTGAPSEASRQ